MKNMLILHSYVHVYRGYKGSNPKKHLSNAMQNHYIEATVVQEATKPLSHLLPTCLLGLLETVQLRALRLFQSLHQVQRDLAA
jgi:hypothetical protein